MKVSYNDELYKFAIIEDGNDRLEKFKKIGCVPEVGMEYNDEQIVVVTELYNIKKNEYDMLLTQYRYFYVLTTHYGYYNDETDFYNEEYFCLEIDEESEDDEDEETEE